MRKLLCRESMSVLILLGFLLFAVMPVAAQETQLERLASKVVKTSANVKPGDVVVVSGGKHNVDLLEAVAIEVTKLGGMPTIFLNTDRLSRARFADTPEQYLGQEPKHIAEWLKHIDVWISVPGVQNPQQVYGDIPEKRFAKTMQAGRVIREMINDAKIRLVGIGYPTQEQATINGLDFKTYEAMHWKAVNADYRKIAEQGNRLAKILEGASTVRVTSPHGTDFTFRVGSRRTIFIDDGIVTEQEAKAKLFLTRVASLPGGSVSFAPIETSANGKVVVPKHRCRFEPLTNVSFEFNNGKVKNFRASSGGWCFEQTMDAYTGPKDMLGYVQIGLNPELKVIETPGDYRPADAAGLVTIGIGNNELYGGNNKNTGSFDFPIVNATVEVDGRVIIRDGKLTF